MFTQRSNGFFSRTAIPDVWVGEEDSVGLPCKGVDMISWGYHVDGKEGAIAYTPCIARRALAH